jgi:SAM-dependent methyltransferase
MRSIAHKSLRLPYRAGQSLLKRFSLGQWLLEWGFPLNITRKLLRAEVASRADYASGWLLDIGCGDKPYQELFTKVDRYFGLDWPGSKADVHADAMSLPFANASFDTVLCNQVLEHVPEPWRLMDEAVRVLRPDGFLILTAPQTWHLHHVPFDYYRYTRFGLKFLAERSGLEIIDLEPTCGLWATLAQRITDTVANVYLQGVRSFVAHKIVFAALAPVQIIGYALDKICGKHGDTLDYVMVGRKHAEVDNSCPNG